MIVSVSGRIGHGKDLVGKIIQAYMEFPDASKLSILRIIESGIDNPNTKIKKWADKLKEMLCIMTGTTREQWEESDFKKTQLGEEWWYWKLEREGGYTPILLPYNIHAEILQMYEDLKLIKPTYRNLLELLGTECGRNIIHPNVWVNALMSEYKPSDKVLSNLKDQVQSGASEVQVNSKAYNQFCPNWIITDTRFSNELDAVKSKEVLTIKVTRSDVLTNSITGKSFPIKVHKKEHESETSLDNAEFDYYIENNSTILDLVEKVKQILIKEKIIKDVI